MRIVATLSWYDEQPSALAAWVAAVAPLVDAVVAIDGAYEHFPGGRGCSPDEQDDALVSACRKHNLELSSMSHTPGDSPPWPSEVDKRACELALGVKVAGEGGWLLRLDADEFLNCREPAALRMALEDEHDVDVLSFDLFGEAVGDQPPYRYPIRRLVRALPGLTCDEAHYVTMAPGTRPHDVSIHRWRYLVGHPDWHPLEPTRCITPALIEAEHRHQDRSLSRDAARWELYRLRNELGLELIRR